MIDAFGIFEGGGAKGLAHVGALKAAELNDVRFIGVAGSSAGAIVAALVAAGYTSSELFDKDTDDGSKVFDESFRSYFGFLQWYEFLVIKKAVAVIDFFCLRRPLLFILAIAFLVALGRLIYAAITELLLLSGIWIAAWLLTVMIVLLLINALLPFGIFSSAKFEKVFNRKLREKLFPDEAAGSERVVHFRDLPMPLNVVSTDLIGRRSVSFSQNETPDYPVAKAVRSSITIPGFFYPVVEGGMVLVDGGVLSNFPAWAYDKERRSTDKILSTIGFRLQTSSRQRRKWFGGRSFMKYATRLGLVFFGDNDLQIRAIEDLHLISIKVSSGTLDFEMGRERKVHLFNEGYTDALDYFRTKFTGPRNSEEITDYLSILHTEIVNAIGRRDLHLRLNIAIPVAPHFENIRVLYPFNMDDDADDCLKLAIDAGAMGRCLSERRPVLVDMEIARSKFKTMFNMRKYQQALVRRDLKTLLSVPITSQGIMPQAGVELFGVLSIDSKEDLLVNFLEITSGTHKLTIAIDSAVKRIAGALRREK